jgi:excisionase family DNA binding protein
MSSAEVDRVVVVHGRTDKQTTIALESVGLVVAVEIGDTTVWASRTGGAAQELDAPRPAPAGSPGRLLLTVGEAAAVLGVGRTTVYGLIGNGDLEVVHVGRAARVPLVAVEDFVQRVRRPASRSHPTGTIRALGSADASQLSAAAESAAS